MAREGRQGAAHQHGGDEHDEARQREAERELEGSGLEERAREGDVAHPGHLHDQRKREAVAADCELENDIGVERSLAAVHPAAEPSGADREAAHEHGQHDGLRVGRRTDQLNQELCPDHLVHEPGEAAQQERGPDRAGHPLRSPSLLPRLGSRSAHMPQSGPQSGWGRTLPDR